MVVAGIFWMFVCTFSVNADIQSVRALYQLAPSNENTTEELLRLLENERYDAPLYAGYKGATKMVMARFALNPYSKLKYFNEGKSELETAISKDRNNIELRYLRYTIQLNAPGFLGYDDHIAEDKRFLVNTVNTLSDKELRKMIVAVLNNKPIG